MEQELPLKDIHLPDAISWWPPAIGWWVLALISLALVAFLLWWSIRHLQQGRYRKAAIKELDKQHTIYQENGDATLYIAQLNQLLRRVAVQCYGRDTVAQLTGDKWLDFLQQTCPISQFDRVVAEDLLRSAYVAEPAVAIETSTHVVQVWIKKHRRPK